MSESPAAAAARHRPTAVTINALLVALGGMGALLLAASLLATSEGAEELLAGSRLVSRAMATVLVLSAVAAAATAIGLWRLRHWARLAVLIIAGTVVTFCASSALVVLALPLGELLGPDADADQLRRVMLAAYALPGAIGSWWLYQFTRPPMKALFAEDGPITPARIPLTVALIGWATVLGGVACLLLALARVPAVLGGALLTGWLAGAFYLLLAGAQFYIGRGLLGLDERARRAGVAFFSVATLYGMAGAMLPGARDAALAYGLELGESVGAPSLFALDGVWWLLTALLILGFALPAWLLVKWRHAFARGD